MNNIFENAYFGKSYKTREGKRAILIGFNPLVVALDDISNKGGYYYRVFEDGRINDDRYPTFETKFDIVSEWQEEIRGGEKLDKLAEECNPCSPYDKSDICGEPLEVGDKVSVRHDQLTRIGVVLGFTKTRVTIGLDYTANGYKSDSELTQVKVAPYNLTKVINQNIGLRDYFKLRNGENKSRTSYEIEN